MVKRLKLNEKTLRDAEPKPGVSYQIFDTDVIGCYALHMSRFLSVSGRVGQAVEMIRIGLHHV